MILQNSVKDQTMSMIHVRDLTMRFGGLLAVDALDFEAYAHRITSVIGPNGAGKTTLFNCLTGFYKPSGGQISLHNASGQIFDLGDMRVDQIVQKAKLARTFQNIRLFPSMTVLENLMVAQNEVLGRASRWNIAGFLKTKSFMTVERHAMELARHWISCVGLEGKANDLAGSLPYGLQRRLEIARAMCTGPEFLCLDEPAAGLNPRESLDLNQLLMMIHREYSVGIVLIEHDMDVVMNVSDHIVVLDYGRKIAEGSPDQIKHNPDVIKAYLGEEHA